MAERRMFAKSIIDSDAFLEMSASAQSLYFHLAMRADDEGFVNNPKRIQRMVGSADDDLKILIAKRYVLVFESGIIVIKHWKIHNYIQNDRFKPTMYQEERAMLTVKASGAYTDCAKSDIPALPDASPHKPKLALNGARQKRYIAKLDSELPYSFEYKIRAAFVGKTCPICGCTMNYENNLVSPTIQHNKPISLGGKHEIENISVICRGCNSSIQNRTETPPYNTDEVIAVWECIGNVSGMDTQVRLGKDSQDKSSRSNGGFLSDSEADDLLQDAQQLNAVFDAAERAGFPHSTATMDALNQIVSDYGSEAVIRAIGGCVENSVIKLNYLRGILKSDPTGGAKPKEEAYTPKPHWEDEG